MLLDLIYVRMVMRIFTSGHVCASQKLVELLIVPDGELKVTRVDPGLLVVPGSIAGKLENLCSQEPGTP